MIRFMVLLINILKTRSHQDRNKKVVDYQIFIEIDSGENIPSGYQKITYHSVFDVKYNLRLDSQIISIRNDFVSMIIS
jgi:hypothetical protein